MQSMARPGSRSPRSTMAEVARREPERALQADKYDDSLPQGAARSAARKGEGEPPARAGGREEGEVVDLLAPPSGSRSSARRREPLALTR
jgi:hypothetical protein